MGLKRNQIGLRLNLQRVALFWGKKVSLQVLLGYQVWMFSGRLFQAQQKKGGGVLHREIFWFKVVVGV